MDQATYQKIERLCAEIRRLQQELSYLLAQDAFEARGADIQHSLEQILTEAQRKAEQEISLALQRINLRDDRYRFLRAIDGDTIEVDPPGELREWMRDVHVRLYGIDAPERGEEGAQYYTDLLRGICGIDEGKLSIVWERERRGTEYAGFPLSSFERGIGNIFVDIPERSEQVLYVNALLASCPQISLTRGGKPLLRGSRVMQTARFDHWPHWHSHWPGRWWPRHMLQHLGQDNDAISLTVQRIARDYPLGFPFVLPRKALLDPDAQIAFITGAVPQMLMRYDCPECRDLAMFIEADLQAYVKAEKASLFDLLLVLAGAQP